MAPLTGNPYLEGHDTAVPSSTGGLLKIDLAAGKASGVRVDVPAMNLRDTIVAALEVPAASSSREYVNVTSGITSIESGGFVLAATNTDGLGGGGADQVLVLWLQRQP